MKINIKIYISIILSIIAITNILYFIHPINIFNRDKAVQICKDYNIIDVEDDAYLDRIEFLEALLKAIGMTDLVIENYKNSELSYPIVNELIDAYMGAVDEETLDRVETYDSLCKIAADNACLQVYMIDNSQNLVEFSGEKYVTVQEAVTMIQACLDVEKDKYRREFSKYSTRFNKLYLKSHLSGILLPYDCAYWSVIDTKLKKSDVAVLLYRLLNKKRVKYIVGIGYPVIHNSAVDENRSITYLEYLKTINEGK